VRSRPAARWRRPAARRLPGCFPRRTAAACVPEVPGRG
jgi:hypothetical protein